MTGNALGSVTLALLVTMSSHAAERSPWLLGTAYKLPSEYTNQESGYFSMVEGHNGRLYIGAAKYGVNAYLLEFDPKTETTRMVIDAQQLIGTTAKGFAAQAKFHTRNNVGVSGTIYVATKQGYPEKGEQRGDYPGGYAMTYDPATAKATHYGIAKPQHGIISIIPDESRGVAYISTCSDTRPIEHAHFMILDLAKKTYRDLGDMEHLYAFIVLDQRGRAYHPIRGGQVARYDPATDKLERLDVTVDGAPSPAALRSDHTILNWETSPDRKTLYAVEMTTNQLFAFEMTGSGTVLAGRSLGALLPRAKRTDCRALAVGPDGRVWAAVSHVDAPEGQTTHLVGYTPGQAAPRALGPIGVANPTFTTFTDASGKPKPWHHTMRKSKDGTLTPWQPMGVTGAADGTVYVLTIAPFTVLKFAPEQVK